MELYFEWALQNVQIPESKNEKEPWKWRQNTIVT